MLTPIEVNEGNKKIAKFLGWFQEKDSSDQTWFEYGTSAIYVAYSLHPSGLHHDLPFHRDWNYLMKAVTKLEDLGLCLHTSNYCKLREARNNLADHIGFNLLEDYYTSIDGSVLENINGNDTRRYFQVQRMDAGNRIEAVWKTIVMFLEYYQDETVRIVNISNNEVNRVERKSEEYEI